MSTASLLRGTVFHPVKTFRSLQSDPRAAAKGARALLLIGLLYTLTVTGLAVAGALIFAPAFLSIAPENYYAIEIVFAVPVFFLAWLAAGGVGHLLSRKRGGLGNYEGFLGAFAFAVAVPSFVTWIPETVLAVLLLLGAKQQEIMDATARPGLGQAIGIAYQVAAVLWIIALTVIAVRVAGKTGIVRSLAVGIFTALVFLSIVIVFIR